MCRTCGCPAWCTRAWCGRQATAPAHECDTAAAERLPGVVKVVRDGNFLAVVAAREFQAITAMNALARQHVAGDRRLPKQDDFLPVPTSMPSRTRRLEGSHRAAGGTTIEASYTRPYQMHGSIGPSCAVARLVDGADDGVDAHPGRLSGSRGDRRNAAVAAKTVHLIQVEGSGCYGHNGADDAAADAALIARGARPYRCGCSGCASRNRPGSRTGRR